MSGFPFDDDGPPPEVVERARDAFAAAPLPPVAFDFMLEFFEAEGGDADALVVVGVGSLLEALERVRTACRDVNAFEVAAVLGQLHDAIAEAVADHRARG